MVTDPNSSILKKVTLGGGSRKVHIKEGESEILDNVESCPQEEKEIEHFSTTINKLVEGSDRDIISNLSKAENCKQLKDKIKTSEQTLKTLEAIKRGEKKEVEVEVEIKNVLSYIEEQKILDDGDGSKFSNDTILDNKKENKKEVRCIQAIFQVMVIDITNSFGTMLINLDFRERYWMFLTDPRSIYAILAFLGICLSFLGVVDSPLSYCGVLSLLAIPSLLVVFMAMNIPLFKLLALRFFTILKSMYILIFVISGVILSRERENSLAISVFFIMSGVLMFIWGLFSDCFFLPWRVITMQRCSIVISIMLFVLIVLLHIGSLDVSDYRLEFMGHFNLSLVSLMANALNTLFWLNLQTVYVAFIDPTRLVTLYSPITNKKIIEGVSQMLRSTAKVSKGEVSSLFPPALTTTDGKIKYIMEQLEMLKTKFNELYSDLTNDEKMEVDSYKAARRKTEMFIHQLKTLIQSRENKEEMHVVASSFCMQEINSENTLGKWLLGTKTSKRISKFGLPFQFLWLFGVVVTILAMNKFIGEVYALTVFLCLPTFSNFLLFNISILKQLFQFETLVIAISSFIFCLSGAILLRNREYNWCYFLFFAIFWICSQGINFSDSMPGSTRYRNVIVGSVSGLIVYFTILVGVFVDKLEGQDFAIPMFGSLNITISNQCANAGLYKM